MIDDSATRNVRERHDRIDLEKAPLRALDPMNGHRGVALITGVQSRTCFQVARALGLCGLKIVLAVDDVGVGTVAATRLGDSGLSVEVVEADVTDIVGMRTVLDYVVRTHGRLDVLVNQTPPTSAVPMTEAAAADARGCGSMMQATFERTVLSPLLLTKLLLPLMKRAPRARIINLSADFAQQASSTGRAAKAPDGWTASLSRMALDALTVRMDAGLRYSKVTATAVHRGDVRTDDDDDSMQ